jgi:hypothetical protein
MRKQQSTLLAGIAALALLAGTGLASAQGAAGDQGNAKQGGAAGTAGQTMRHKEGGTASHGAMSPSTAQHGALNQPQGGKGGQSAQNKSVRGVGPSTAQQGPGKNAQLNRNAQETNPAGINAQNKSKAAQTGNREKFRSTAQGQQFNRTNRSAQEERFNRTHRAASENRYQQRGNAGTASTAQRMERGGQLQGLQGNAAVNERGNVQLTEQQRTRIRDTVINASGAPRVGRVNFDVRVGTVIPRREIRVVPVPETLVRIEPRWRGYLYFVYGDEVVIVSPRTMRIVAVLPA